MRVLVIEPGPSFSVDDVRKGIVSGLKANRCEVNSFNLGDRVAFYTEASIKRKGRWIRAFEYDDACALAAQGVKAACWDMLGSAGTYDVAIVVSSFYIPPSLYDSLRQRGVHVVLWLTESPYEDERQIPIASYADTVIVNDPTNLDKYRAVNNNSHYIPHAYNPGIHHSYQRSDVHGFSFVGTGFPQRIEFFEQVDWPCDPVFAGHWDKVSNDSPLKPYIISNSDMCIDNKDAANLYRASLTSANLYRKEAMAPDLVDGWAMGPREVELAACGVWFARESRPEGDELFPMLPTFTEPAELSEQIRWALDNPDKREEAARAAQAAVVGRTFDKHTAQLLRLIEA